MNNALADYVGALRVRRQAIAENWRSSPVSLAALNEYEEAAHAARGAMLSSLFGLAEPLVRCGRVSPSRLRHFQGGRVLPTDVGTRYGTLGYEDAPGETDVFTVETRLTDAEAKEGLRVWPEGRLPKQPYVFVKQLAPIWVLSNPGDERVQVFALACAGLATARLV